MNERELQDYLYLNPEVLFPSGNVTEKSREYFIQGKRIDLLFVVDGVRYIIEVKNVPIQREHIGQVVEYYGLMRQYFQDVNLIMVLVSSSIPKWRAAYLEELGIRCVEISAIPKGLEKLNNIARASRTFIARAKPRAEVDSHNGEDVCFEDVACPANKRGMVFAHNMLRNSLEPIRKDFSEYDVVPFKITRSVSLDYDLDYDRDKKYGSGEFTRGGVWWAYRFGSSEDLPPNDVPNVSIIANTTGLDVTLNAELQPSQRLMLTRIKEGTAKFNRLLADHGRLWLKTYLKFEHQPRFYHWILADHKSPGDFNGEVILQLRYKHEKSFINERNRWIQKISDGNKELTLSSVQHLKNRTRQLNLAIRLVEPLGQTSSFWSLPTELRSRAIIDTVRRMKPLLDFFLK